jgi:nicotinamide-nucleotide amidase
MTTKELAAEVVKTLREQGLHITTVESCTGGGVANAITNIPGSSEVLRDAVVTYCNEAKIALGVPDHIIRDFTVYSQMVALCMAWEGRKTSVGADISVGVTGSLSRPDPENPNSQVGTVYIGVLREVETHKYPLQYAKTIRFDEPDREKAKDIVLGHVFKMVLDACNGAAQYWDWESPSRTDVPPA